MRSQFSVLSPSVLKTSRVLINSTLVGAAVLVTACGARNSNGDQPVYQGEAADNITTESLQRNAANTTGAGMGTAIDSVLQTISGSAAIGKAISVPGLGLTGTQSSAGALNDPTESGPLLSEDFDNRVRTESSSLFDSSLGLSGSATSTRVGNTITVDPDEAEICAQQNLDNSLDQATCAQLIADLSVTIDAASDQSGLITYFFRNESVVEIGYSPISGSYELKLAGLSAMHQRVAELDASTGPATSTMSGSIKFEANVLNATAGAEAASMKLFIPEALRISDPADGTNVSLAPSTILEMTADSGSGTASVEIGLGALAIASRNTDLTGSALQQLAMSGLTARADLTSNGNVLTMSNVGIGNGPLVLSIDSLEAVRLSLDTFGFTVNEDANVIALNGNMNMDLMMRNVLGYLDSEDNHNSAADIKITAAGGTIFSELASGIMRVDQGGPLSVEYAVSDGNSSNNGTVNVQQGQCFGENFATDAPIDLTACN